jgi:hypothetical protein
MTKEEVKIWLLEGDYSVFGCGIFSREVLGEPVMKTENAVLTKHIPNKHGPPKRSTLGIA